MRLSLLTASVLAFAVGCTNTADESKSPTASQLPSSPARADAPPAEGTPAATVASAPLAESPAEGPAEKTAAAAAAVEYDINHVIVTGQSNSVANGGSGVLSTTQPYSNLMFDTGVMPMSQCNGDGCWGYDAPAGFAPLVEGDQFFDYPVETTSAGTANQISKIAHDLFGRPKHDVLVTVNGRSGNTYWCLRKGSCSYHDQAMIAPFEQAMNDIANAKRLADAAGATYGVRAVNVIHGESDHYSYSSGSQEFPLDGTDGTPLAIKDYADALLEWQRDYESGVKAITGQSAPVPMFVAQMSTWSDTPGSRIAQWQLDAHARSNGKVVLVTPGYQLNVTEDCIHYDADGERRLGEYFAKAYAQTVLGGKPWEPLRPAQITHAGNSVVVKFHVPKAPLVLDTERVSDPGSYGFDVADAAGNAIAITNVALTGPDTVTLTLAGPAAGGKVRYAMNHQPGQCIGPWQGARGNLRDSDATPSQSGYELFNWAVHFEAAIP